MGNICNACRLDTGIYRHARPEDCLFLLKKTMKDLIRTSGDFRIAFVGFCMRNKLEDPEMVRLSDAIAEVIRTIPSEFVTEDSGP